MKTILFVNFFIIIAIFSNPFAQAKTPAENPDSCKFYKYLAQEKRKLIESETDQKIKLIYYKQEFNYLLSSQFYCGKSFTKNNFNQIILSGQNILKLEKDSIIKIKYIDTLFTVNQKIDSLNFGDKNLLLKLANYALSKSSVDMNLCDNYYVRAFKDTSIKFSDVNINNYFSNLYSLYLAESVAAKKIDLKKRLISEYFILCKYIEDNKLNILTRESITNVFNSLIKNCSDLLEDLAGFMKDLPKDNDLKINTVNNFLALLKNKSCTDSKEYEMLIDTIIRIDKSSNSVIAKAELLVAKKRYSEAITVFNSAKAMITSASIIEDIDFRILEMQYHNLKNYQIVYKSALTITGQHRSKALLYAAKCVAMSANDCGSSTFERKCNYLYAAELCDRAGDSGAAKTYRANGPTSEDKFNNSNLSSISLSCWGVTVSIR